MRPIIIDMKDMSDSREVYESRPNPVLPGFIWLLLAMIAAAFVWMAFFKIDIVVKAVGTVSAAEEVATVTNQVPGTITARMIEDGQNVEKGDVLYTVSHEELDLQLSALEEQLEDYIDKEEMLRAYMNWLEEGEEFPMALMDNLYYSEIASRKLLVELGEQSMQQAYVGELSAYETQLDANNTMIDYCNDAIHKSRQLIEAIKSRSNTFGIEDAYYWNYMENYLAQYQDIIVQYDVSINKLQRESNTAKQTMEELEAEKQELQNSIQDTEINTVSVSGSDAVLTLAVQEQQTQQQIQNLEAQITAQRAVKEAADNSISEYNTQKNSALNAYEKENIAAIENSILGYEQNLAAYEGTQMEYASRQATLLDQGTEVELENLITQEKHSVAAELEACRQSQLQVSQQIQSLNQSIENTTVRAIIGGTVNFAVDLVEGDYIGAGTQVLSIIPESETGEFIVKCYVENKDIAKIHEGMEVTYEIAAYPSREYGTMRGDVMFVSADLKVNNSGSAYYMVETSVDAGQLYNQQGEEGSLRVGMLCETKIVIEKKSVLEILVEKLFHIGK